MTLHKYLYANGNPVKYTDPSGMFSLSECNIASAIGAELYRNQNVIMGMSIMNGIGKSVLTGLSGGDAGEVTAAFLEGMIEGAGTAMLFCAVAAITVTSMAAVFTSVVAADSIVSIVTAIRSVMDGDYMNALVYGAFAVAGIIGVCKWYKVDCQVDYVGERGIANFASWSDNESNIFRAPKIITNSKGEMTNGTYTLNQRDMLVHVDGKNLNKSQFLYHVDANKAVLDASAFADVNNLWMASSGNLAGFADKAKVPVTNGYVGVTGSGELTRYINVYRTKTGHIHGCPGNP